MDDLDRASEREQQARDSAISSAMNKPPEAIAIGRCLDCDEPLSNDLRWCDANCRDNWQRFNKHN